MEYTKEQIQNLGIEFIQNEDKDEMESKYSQSKKYVYTQFCACCGRGIKGEPKYWIKAIEPGDVIPAEITDELLEEVGIVSMGCYPIGSECRKKYPSNYISKDIV